MQLQVNGRAMDVPADWEGESLLVVLRESLGLIGAKYGCGVGLCGACTVLVDGEPTRSCLVPVTTLAGKQVTTVEGLASDGGLHRVQQAWLVERVPQCGYCQAGQIVATVALLERHPKPDESQINEALAGQLCRCGTQARIRAAVRRAAGVQT